MLAWFILALVLASPISATQAIQVGTSDFIIPNLYAKGVPINGIIVTDDSGSIILLSLFHTEKEVWGFVPLIDGKWVPREGKGVFLSFVKPASRFTITPIINGRLDESKSLHVISPYKINGLITLSDPPSGSSVRATSTQTSSPRSSVLFFLRHKNYKVDEGTTYFWNVRLILHDPPGDHSYQMFKESYTLTLTTKWSVSSSASVKVGFEFMGVEGDVGIGIETGVEGGYKYSYTISNQYYSSTVSNDAKYIGPTRYYSGSYYSGGRFIADRFTVRYEVWYDVWWFDWNLNNKVDKGETIISEKNTVKYWITGHRYVNTWVNDQKYRSIALHYDAEYLGRYDKLYGEFEISGGAPEEHELKYTTEAWVGAWIKTTGSASFKAGVAGGTVSVTGYIYQQVAVKKEVSVKLHIHDDEPNDRLVFKVYKDPYFPVFTTKPITSEIKTTNPDEKYVSSSGGGGGGCPTLLVWSNDEWRSEGILNIHSTLELGDVFYLHKLTNTPERIGSLLIMKLSELDNFVSHIDQVGLYIDNNGTMVTIPLLFAWHTSRGAVTSILSYSDDNRLLLYPGEEVILVFDASAIGSYKGSSFYFQIEGFNPKIVIYEK